jgi:peptidoglycan/xylan/chitin deacetylase (PgdA/CDA1 family)
MDGRSPSCRRGSTSSEQPSGLGSIEPKDQHHSSSTGQAGRSLWSMTHPSVGSPGHWPLVLYFHHVSPDLADYTAVTPQDFSTALQLLRTYFEPLDPLTLDDVVAAGGSARPSCLITFDDGYADAYEHAVPLLAAYDWKAVFFVSTRLVGEKEAHPRRGSLTHMDWVELRELQRSGHVVASHGDGHQDLSQLTAEFCGRDIEAARGELRGTLGDVPDWIAFPYGGAPPMSTWTSVRRPELCFGSVKAAPVEWARGGRPIRRTYLPADARSLWRRYVEDWADARWNATSR